MLHLPGGDFERLQHHAVPEVVMQYLSCLPQVLARDPSHDDERILGLPELVESAVFDVDVLEMPLQHGQLQVPVPGEPLQLFIDLEDLCRALPPSLLDEDEHVVELHAHELLRQAHLVHVGGKEERVYGLRIFLMEYDDCGGGLVVDVGERELEMPVRDIIQLSPDEVEHALELFLDDQDVDLVVLE
jgi:hypothetical protein